MKFHNITRIRGCLFLVLVSIPFLLWGQSTDSAWERYTEAGLDAFQQDNYAEAEKQFKAALQEAEKFGSEDPRLAGTLNLFVWLYNKQGKHAEAEPLFRRLLEILEKKPLPGHPDVASGLRELLEFYQRANLYSVAEELLKRLVANQEIPWDKYTSAGRYEYDQGKYAEAIKHYKEALREAEKFEPEDPRLASTLGSLQALYIHSAKYGVGEGWVQYDAETQPTL